MQRRLNGAGTAGGEVPGGSGCVRLRAGPQAQPLREVRDGAPGRVAAADESLMSAFNAACYAASP